MNSNTLVKKSLKRVSGLFSLQISRIHCSPYSPSIPEEVISNTHETISKKNPSITHAAIDPISYMKDFCALIKILCKNKRDYKALGTLDLVLNRTHLLDSATSVVVIAGLCRLNKLSRAKTVLCNLKRKGNVPEFFLYSLVFYCLVRDGKIRDVEAVWEEVRGIGSLYRIDASSFVVHLCKFGEVSEAEKVYAKILMGGGVLEQQSYIALVGGLCRKNEGILARNVLQDMENNSFESDNLTYLALFQCFCRIGNVYEADIVLRKLIFNNYTPDICIYGSFIFGLCKSGKQREAKKLFHKLIKRDQPMKVTSVKQGRRAIFQLNCGGAVPEIMAYETYCRSLCSIGCLEEAVMLVKEMMRKRTVPETCVYNSFVRGLLREGNINKAIAFSNIEKKRGFISPEEIVVPLIQGFCEIGRVDDAYMILCDIVNGGFVPTASICNSLLVRFCKAGRLGDAMQLFERMRDGICGRPDVLTYTTIVKGLCDNGYVLEALSIFREMIRTKVPVNGTLYSNIIRGLCLIGELEVAHKYLNEMIENGYLASFIGWKLLFESMRIGSKNGLSLSDFE